MKEDNVSRKMAKWDVNLKEAIKRYLVITKPMHNLRDKQIDMLTLILLKYTLERNNFKRDSDVWKIVFTADNMAEVRQTLDMNKGVFHNYIHKMKKAGVIKNGQIAPAFNPVLSPDTKALEIVFRFNINKDG
jgi:hypothetical protein